MAGKDEARTDVDRSHTSEQIVGTHLDHLSCLDAEGFVVGFKAVLAVVGKAEEALLVRQHVPEPEGPRGAGREINRIRCKESDDGCLEEAEVVSSLAADDVVLAGEDEAVFEEGDAIDGVILEGGPAVGGDVSYLPVNPVEQAEGVHLGGDGGHRGHGEGVAELIGDHVGGGESKAGPGGLHGEDVPVDVRGENPEAEVLSAATFGPEGLAYKVAAPGGAQDGGRRDGPAGGDGGQGA